MGLDMYINKVKRVDNLKLEKILATEDYVDYLNRPQKYKNCTYKEWCGGNEKLVSKSSIDQVKANMEYDTSPAWAEGWSDYEPSRKGVTKNIAYWRKANAIHNWFVENIQSGNDDCGCYELDKEDLKNLLSTVNEVLESCKLVDGKVYTGIRFTKNGEEKTWEDGKVIKDTFVAEDLLPTCSGFFFGGTEYDEWYYRHLEYTKERIEKILRETDFDNWIVYYTSSW